MSKEKLEIDNSKAKLLLHSCCGPCLTASYERTKNDFEVVPFWFNPNIEPEKEFDKRLNSFNKLNDILKTEPSVVNDEQSIAEWKKAIEGLENEPEGGKRCEKCIGYRLEKTAKEAKKRNFDIFGTTLTVSPYKNSAVIINIGKKLSEQYQIDFLDLDFKKNDGYKRSVELSKQYGLYRQNYCGCSFSQRNLNRK